MRNRGMGTLSAFYIVYFIYIGFSTFASRYFAQIGLSEAQIGVLTSVPALVAMCFMPMWGALADRVRLKKLLLAALTAGSGVSFLLVDACTDFTRLGQAGATKFWPLLALLMLNCFFGQSVMPNATSIAIEYTQSIGKSYGPIRMLGTVGYQAGALLIGLICAHSLRYLYTWQALAIFAAALIALTLPRVGGHQYGGEKISPLRVLKEKRCRLLLAMVFIGTCTSMFYQSFFGAFTQQMGLSNTMTSVITWISVALEIPMLYFAHRLMRWRSIWQWVLIGYVVTGLRWLGFFLAARMNSAGMLIAAQIPAVTVLACFEFLPSLYLGSIVAPELSSSAQTILNLTSFGVARFFGGLLGGFVSQKIGMETMFAIFGVLLLAAAAVFYPVCKGMKNEGRKTNVSAD